MADDKAVDKGYKLGRMFKAFFEFYYLNVLHPAETSSTQLLRAMTVLTDVFEHEDISMCLTTETAGKIAENLDGLSIHTIYVKIPAAFDVFRYLKFQEKCKTEKYLEIARELNHRLEKLDMFKIMYHNYSPFVEIAAEKYGSKQI